MISHVNVMTASMTSYSYAMTVDEYITDEKQFIYNLETINYAGQYVVVKLRVQQGAALHTC